MLLVKFSFVIIFVSTFVCACTGFLFSEKATENPDYPVQCWSEGNNRPISVDSYFQPKSQCLQLNCRKTDSELFIWYIGCGSVGAGDGYKIVENIYLPFPDCCPMAVPVS